MPNEKEYIERGKIVYPYIQTPMWGMNNDARRAFNEGVKAAEDTVNSAPAADVVEVRHGEWVDRYGGNYDNKHYECSLCKKPALCKCDYDVLSNGLWVQDLSDYCPNCGAKMDGKGE